MNFDIAVSVAVEKFHWPKASLENWDVRIAGQNFELEIVVK